MKKYLTLLACLSLFGTNHAEELLKVDMTIDDPNVISSEMIKVIPTNTVIQTEQRKTSFKPTEALVNKPLRYQKWKNQHKKKYLNRQRRHAEPTDGSKDDSTTRNINIKLGGSLNDDSDVTDIWKLLESDTEQKTRTKKHKTKQVSNGAKRSNKRKKVKKISVKQVNQADLWDKIVKRKAKNMFHTLPAKKKKDSCLMQQTILIPDEHVTEPVPTIIPLKALNINRKIGKYQYPANQPNRNIKRPIIRRQKATHSIRIFTPTPTATGGACCNIITKFSGTVTTTRTQLTIIPYPKTDLRIITTTILAPTTKILTEIHYTPYTVTTTSTDTMYMIKMTTVAQNGYRGACELDSNGMVLPANQLPPGLFATPIAEVDRSKFDIIGYAGMNPKNFDPNMQGFRPTNAVRR